QRGHHVYLTGCSVQGQPNSIQLSRPFRETIRLSLIQTGIPEDDAESLARDSGRSLVVLRRLVPAAPGTVQPDWARVDNARTLVPALLAGGWDESTNGDREILEQLSGQKYDQWIANLTVWVDSPDTPIRKEGTTWKISSPRDAWFRLGRYVASVDLERFSSISKKLFSERNPLYDISGEERWLAPVTGPQLKHSSLIRAAIAETLVLLSVFDNQVRSVSNARIFAEQIVKQLLDGANGVRWWSLSGLLQSMAEA